MVVKKLENYLEQNHVWYEKITHPRTYTAQETAASAHIKGKELAKSVMIKLDGETALAVLPAYLKVDFKRIKEISGAKKIMLAMEEDIEEIFPDCTIGAMPPFGNLYQVPVYADSTLENDEDIAFNAGSHMELIKMHFKDFNKLVHPKIHDIHRHTHYRM